MARLPGSSRALPGAPNPAEAWPNPCTPQAGALSLGACLGDHVPTPALQMLWAWILVPDQVGQSSSTAGELFQTVGCILGWYMHSPGTLLIAAPCVSLSMLSLLISSCLMEGDSPW